MDLPTCAKVRTTLAKQNGIPRSQRQPGTRVVVADRSRLRRQKRVILWTPALRSGRLVHLGNHGAAAIPSRESGLSSGIPVSFGLAVGDRTTLARSTPCSSVLP